jgi:hypothetical protein
VQRAEHDEHPRGADVHGVDLARDEEHERERVEDHRDLEQILQVVRGVRHGGWRHLCEPGRREVVRRDL